MFYRCNKCNRFLAAVKDSKNFKLMGTITVEDGKIYVECVKCGKKTEIKIDQIEKGS